MYQNSTGFKILKNNFPRISDDKLEEGVVDGHQVTQLLEDVKFEDQLLDVKTASWKTFQKCHYQFLEKP